MLKRTLHIAACLLLGFLSPAAAQTFYVAPQGAAVSPTPDGSLAKPFDSVFAAFRSGKIDGGETILLMDGRHGQIKLTNLAMATPVIIRPQNARKAHADSVTVTGYSKNLVFQNLNVWPSAPAFVSKNLVTIGEGGSNITIEGFVLRSAPDAPNYLEWSAETWNATKINGIRSDAASTIIRGNTLVATYMAITVTGPNALVEKNFVDGFNGDGMRGLGANGVFRGNRVVNCVKTDTNHDDGFQSWGGTAGLVIDGNTIHEWVAKRTDHPLRCRIQGIGMFGGVYKNLKITNNVISGTQYHGITVIGVDGAVIANNTVVNSSGNPGGTPYISLRPTKAGIEPTNVLIANNVAMSIRGTPSVERNVVFKNNSVLTAPVKMLKDVLAFDYRPTAASGFIDTGDKASAPKLDIVGTSRPQGAGADRGAYEGSSGAVAPLSGAQSAELAGGSLVDTNTTAKFVAAP